MTMTTLFVGFVLVILGVCFSLLIALDAANQKQYKLYTSSKVKSRQYRS